MSAWGRPSAQNAEGRGTAPRARWSSAHTAATVVPKYNSLSAGEADAAHSTPSSPVKARKPGLPSASKARPSSRSSAAAAIDPSQQDPPESLAAGDHRAIVVHELTYSREAEPRKFATAHAGAIAAHAHSVSHPSSVRSGPSGHPHPSPARRRLDGTTTAAGPSTRVGRGIVTYSPVKANHSKVTRSRAAIGAQNTSADLNRSPGRSWPTCGAQPAHDDVYGSPVRRISTAAAIPETPQPSGNGYASIHQSKATSGAAAVPPPTPFAHTLPTDSAAALSPQRLEAAGIPSVNSDLDNATVRASGSDRVNQSSESGEGVLHSVDSQHEGSDPVSSSSESNPEKRRSDTLDSGSAHPRNDTPENSSPHQRGARPDSGSAQNSSLHSGSKLGREDTPDSGIDHASSGTRDSCSALRQEETPASCRPLRKANTSASAFSGGTPERSMVPASALISLQEPISPEAEVALAELKAEALSLRRASTGNSGAGTTRCASGEVCSSGTLLKELSFRQLPMQQGDETEAGDSDTDSVALSIEMGSLAVSDAAQLAAESALASLEAKIASMVAPALAAMADSAAEAPYDETLDATLGAQHATAKAATSTGASSEVKEEVKGFTIGDNACGSAIGGDSDNILSGRVSGDSSSGDLNGKPIAVHVGSLTNAADSLRSSEPLSVQREARISGNKRSGRRRSADWPSAEAAHADKENYSTAISKRSSSERNALCPLTPQEAAEKLPDRNADAGLATAVTANLLQQPVPSEVDELWRARQLQRLQLAYRSALAGDVAALKAAVQQYREQVARLQCQKQLLLNQVLRLEAEGEEDEAAHADLTAERDSACAVAAAARAEAEGCRLEMEDCRREAAVARAQAAAARVEAAAAQEAAAVAHARAEALERKALAQAEMPRESASPTEPGFQAVAGSPGLTDSPIHLDAHGLRLPLACVDASDDGWADAPTVETLLAKIVVLWDRLHMPLMHRSRFYLSFRGREFFYYEAEFRRLAWLVKQLDSAAHAESADGSAEGSSAAEAAPVRAAQRKQDKALRRLEWERKFLAAQLKQDFDGEALEELFLAWNVHRESKERKMQLVRKLWAPDTTWDQEGMRRSSELVMQLHGAEPAAETAEGAYDMVFGRPQGENVWRSMLATGSTMLAPLLGRTALRLPPIPSTGSALKVDQSFMASFTNRLSRLSPGPRHQGSTRQPSAPPYTGAAVASYRPE